MQTYHVIIIFVIFSCCLAYAYPTSSDLDIVKQIITPPDYLRTEYRRLKKEQAQVANQIRNLQILDAPDARDRIRVSYLREHYQYLMKQIERVQAIIKDEMKKKNQTINKSPAIAMVPESSILNAPTQIITESPSIEVKTTVQSETTLNVPSTTKVVDETTTNRIEESTQALVTTELPSTAALSTDSSVLSTSSTLTSSNQYISLDLDTKLQLAALDSKIENLENMMESLVNIVLTHVVLVEDSPVTDSETVELIRLKQLK